MLEKSKIIIKHREQIDKIDTSIINLLHKRFETAKEIAKYKKKQKYPIFSKKREVEAIKSRSELANKKGISPKFISLLFKLVFSESRNVQRKVLATPVSFDKKSKI